MTNRDNTYVTDYHLVKLAIDDQPIAFTNATITQTIIWTGQARSRRRSTHWHGEIVSPTYKPDRGDPVTHRLAAETSEGYRLAGYFKVVRSDSEYVDIAGTSALMRTN